MSLIKNIPFFFPLAACVNVFFCSGKAHSFHASSCAFNFSLSHSSTTSFRGVVYFSSVNNFSIFSSVDLSVNRTASAGGGSDKK